MKASLLHLNFLLIPLFFSYRLIAQDNRPVMKQPSQSRANAKDANYLKDSTLLKKGVLGKSATNVAPDSTASTPSHFQFNVTYESNDVYLGRKDSTVLPLVTPQISYIFKS